MGGEFLVGGWVVSFVMAVGSVVANGAENSWAEKERDRGERDKEREEEKKIIKKEYLNEVLKKKKKI